MKIYLWFQIKRKNWRNNSIGGLTHHKQTKNQQKWRNQKIPKSDKHPNSPKIVFSAVPFTFSNPTKSLTIQDPFKNRKWRPNFPMIVTSEEKAWKRKERTQKWNWDWKLVQSQRRRKRGHRDLWGVNPKEFDKDHQTEFKRCELNFGNLCWRVGPSWFAQKLLEFSYWEEIWGYDGINSNN